MDYVNHICERLFKLSFTNARSQLNWFLIFKKHTHHPPPRPCLASPRFAGCPSRQSPWKRRLCVLSSLPDSQLLELFPAGLPSRPHCCHIQWPFSPLRLPRPPGLTHWVTSFPRRLSPALEADTQSSPRLLPSHSLLLDPPYPPNL